MAKKLNITEARKQLLSLPDTLKQGEEIEIYRHEKPVLKIVKPAETKPNPFSILNQAMEQLPVIKRQVPRSLAHHYKTYLYGKKA